MELQDQEEEEPQASKAKQMASEALALNSEAN